MIRYNLENQEEYKVLHETKQTYEDKECPMIVTYANMSLLMQTETYAMNQDDFFNKVFVSFEFKKVDKSEIVRTF